MDDLADLPGLDGQALLVQQEDLGAGDRPPDRSRPGVELLRRQVGRAECLGQPVHEEDSRPRERLPQPPQHLRGDLAAGVGQDAKAVKSRRSPGPAPPMQQFAHTLGIPASTVMRL